MPPKRMHTKSRNGCMTCRRRRVKCDEIRPICTNCTRRELDCVYAAYCPPGRPGISRSPSSPPASSSSSSSSSSSPSPPSQAVSPRLRTLPLPPPLQQSHTPASTKPRKNGSTSSPAPTPLAALARQLDSILLGARPRPPSPLPSISLSREDLDNLSLLHHFTIRTYNSLTNDGSGEIYRSTVPRIALQYQLTMHSLLAVTALHVSKTAESSVIASRHRMIAASHYDRAVRSLRMAILERSQPAEALFAASTMIAVYGFAFQATSSGPSHTPRAFTWIPLIKGVYAVLREWWTEVQQGELAPLMTKGARNLIEDCEVFLALPTSLFDLALETPSTPSVPHDNSDDEIVDAVSAPIYKRVLGQLRNVWNNFWTTGYQLSTCIQWFVYLPDEYVTYLWQGRPRALVIFCHFLCMIKKLDGFWWIKGSAQETFVEIEGRLRMGWRERWLGWPRSIIMGDVEVIGESL